MSIEAQAHRLIGRAVRCSIGEPWDFESEAGQNCLTGIVLASAGAESFGKEVVVCKVNTFRASGHSINLIQATKRHAVPGTLIEELLAGEAVSCNFAYQHGWHDLEAVPFLDTREPIADGGLLIGSIHLSSPPPCGEGQGWGS